MDLSTCTDLVMTLWKKCSASILSLMSKSLNLEVTYLVGSQILVSLMNERIAILEMIVLAK